MKVSLNWLSDHLDLSSRSTAQLSDLLTFAGIEVEGITERGVRSDRLVVGQVISFVPHPNADRLRLCQVDDGSGTPRQIVCGAKNFAEGDKVPVALPGAVLPGGFEIKESPLRGVLSQGMLCAGREIGFSDDADGLMILPADAPVGTPIHDYLEVDTVIEVEVTPNRPDWLSHLGMARELSALAQIPLKGRADHTAATVPAADAGDAVRLDDAQGCPFYTARRIRGVKVAPSPAWLVRKLESIGLRPINNIVDITNYVLMEMGQPLHAFDLAKLQGGIVVRAAGEGESFTALDGKTHALTTADLVIADDVHAAALAGVMGGESSGVTETTTDILLEAAWFHPTRVRHTSRRLGLISDSSYRFERGTDPAQVAGASELAARLILELAGGTAEETLLTAGAPPVLTGEVTLDLPRAQRLLGTPVSEEEVTGILTRLNLQPAEKPLTFRIPGYRQDLQRPVDLVEEIARVYGIANIPASTEGRFVPASAADAAYDYRMSLRRNLAGQGVFEALTIKLVSGAQLEDALGTTPQLLPALPLRNPLSDDHTTMRPSLVPGLLATAARNIRMGTASLRFFETGTIFASTPDGKAIERDALALLLSGPVKPASWSDSAPRIADAADLRGLLEALAPGLSVKLKPVKSDRLLIAAQVIVNGKPVGLCGQVHPARVRAIDARHPIHVAELDLALLQKAVSREVKFEEIPRFPAITRDIALEVPADLTNSRLEDFFSAQKEPLLIGVALFDVFADPTGQKLAADKKSLAYTLTYRDPAKTLATAEADAVHTRIVESLKKALPVSVR
ncbi:MAG: phenylalanine--tRNA ligase subunit beta [Verrucomicrobiota bacterium]